MKDDITFQTIDIAPTQETFQSKMSQEEPIDYYQLVRRQDRQHSSATFYFNGTWWATGDNVYRIIDLEWNNWDMQVTYSRVLVDWLASMTYKLTKVVNGITINWNDISVPAWKTCRVSNYMNSWTQNTRVVPSWGSILYLTWDPIFTSTNMSVAFVNASTSDASFTIKWRTLWTDRPNFGILIEIF